MIIRTIIGLVIVLLVVVLMVELMRRQSLFYPETFPAGDWEPAGIPHQPESIWFEASDGTRLHGWLFESGVANAPLIIFYHGNGGNITHRVVPASALADHGMDVFLFDYRGYGRSEGSPSESALYDDALAAWDVMRERHGGAMATYGESLGGPYAAWVSAERDVCATIMDSTFPSARAVAREIYRPIPIHWLMRSGLETARHLDRARIPVLVLHSTADRVIPFRLGKDLYEMISSEKEFFQSETAPHAAMSWYDSEDYYRTVRDFVLAHCSGKVAP